MDDLLGSDGEEENLALSGSSIPEDEPIDVDSQLEFDMWPGQFSLASVVPTARQASWSSDLHEKEPTFNTYLAGSLNTDAMLLAGVPGKIEKVSHLPARMTRSLKHMPSFMTETLEERIQLEIESIFDDIEDIPAVKRILGSSDRWEKFGRQISTGPGLLYLSDSENNDDERLDTVEKRDVSCLSNWAQLQRDDINVDYSWECI